MISLIIEIDGIEDQDFRDSRLMEQSGMLINVSRVRRNQNDSAETNNPNPEPEGSEEKH